jgi:biopolymer transport protein ExbD
LTNIADRDVILLHRKGVRYRSTGEVIMVATAYRRYPRHRVNAYQAHADDVMSAMNTTPLIDVLLVLLVVLIMAVPISTHILPVDLPQGPGSPAPVPQIALTISAQGQVFWNGSAVSHEQLRGNLASAARHNPQPVIRFHPDPQASYDASVQVIALAGDAGIDKFAFAGNEQFRTFSK